VRDLIKKEKLIAVAKRELDQRLQRK